MQETGVLNIAAFTENTGRHQRDSRHFWLRTHFSDDRLGLGLLISNDKIGVTRETQFNSSYSYKIPMKKGTLSFGLGAGFVLTNSKWSELIVLDPGDENYLVDSKTFVVPNFSFGTYYSGLNYFASVSIPKLIGHKFDFNKNKYVLKNTDEYSYVYHRYLLTFPKLKPTLCPFT
jgi:type IX secretion system PorP/SprF family membrane protein